MDIAEYIEALEVDGERMAGAVAAAGPDAPVPSCPEWAVRDLVFHQGGIQRWATAFVAGAKEKRTDVDFEATTGPNPSDAELVEWLRQGHLDLVAALTSASPDVQCWSFLAAPSPLAFWARRQAHETSIHRVDAELAARHSPTSVSPPFAADGLDELLTGFVVRRKLDPATESTRAVVFSCLDADTAWRMTVDGETIAAEAVGCAEGADGADGADCVVRGTASDLYHALWRRRGLDGIEIMGDAAVLELILDGARI
jgi:uncharacterized protein (TIGR03083 family)